jgi:anti-sigma regulatory factor (Ser/Thr protein kinase)
MRHVGALYPSRRDLVSRIVPLLVGALDRAEAVALAVQPDTAQALRAELGDLTGVTLLDHPGGPAGHSGQTMAVRRARELRELAGGAGPVTFIAEHNDRFDGADGRFWTEFEAAISLTLAATAVNLICFYPEVPTHLPVLGAALRNHPELLVDGTLRLNTEHRPPDEVLAETPVPPPALLGPPDLRLDLHAVPLSEGRRTVEEALLAADYGRDRAEDVVFAVNEIATNAVQHGSTPAELHMWTTRRSCVVEVHDGGELDAPLPGIRPPRSSEPRGRGVWVARQACDCLHVWHDVAGTHVRMHVPD